MPSNLITNMTAGVGAGAFVDIIPPAGQAYKITDVGSQHAFVGNVPDVMVSLRDAVLADAIIWNDPTVDPGRRTRQLRLYVTMDNYCRLTNTGAAGGNISWYGFRVNANNVIVDLVSIGAGAEVNIIPPAGQNWCITEWGASKWSLAGDLNADIQVRITDGTLVATAIVQPTMVRAQDKAVEWYINSNCYLRVFDDSAGGIIFGYSGLLTGKTIISGVSDIGIGGTLNILPPAGQEWVITEFAGETWAGGGAPNNYPDLQVSMVVGANLSEVLEAGSVSADLRWNTSLMELHIDQAHSLRVTNINAAANECGYLGYLLRTYS